MCLCLQPKSTASTQGSGLPTTGMDSKFSPYPSAGLRPPRSGAAESRDPSQASGLGSLPPVRVGFILFLFCFFVLFCFWSKTNKSAAPSAVWKTGSFCSAFLGITSLQTINPPWVHPPTSDINKPVIEPRTHLQREDPRGLGSQRTRQEAAHSQA